MMRFSSPDLNVYRKCTFAQTATMCSKFPDIYNPKRKKVSMPVQVLVLL